MWALQSATRVKYRFYPDSGETSSNYLMENDVSFQETSFYPGIAISRKCHFVPEPQIYYLYSHEHFNWCYSMRTDLKVEKRSFYYKTD